MGDDDEADRFRDEGVIGEGATSVVRAVFDPLLMRRTALKVLTRPTPRTLQQFLAEAQITAQLQHPGIPPVHRVGPDAEAVSWINMKLVTGHTLEEHLTRLGDRRLDPEPLDQLLTVLVKVCDALAYAHSRGVLHRDVKPANVMLGQFGEVYLMDWGIAQPLPTAAKDSVRTTGAWRVENKVVGTPDFMAPEQIDGHAAGIDERTDIYALGGLLYAVLTGEPPHEGGTVLIVMARAIQGEIRPPSERVQGLIPPGLQRIAMKALALDPDDRHRSAEQFREELEAFRRGSWHLPTRTIAAGTVLVAEGDRGDEAYVLTRGRCEVSTVARGAIRELHPGDVFGEMAVLTQRPRTSTVTASTECVVQVVTRESLTKGLGLDTWSGRFVQALAQRFAEVDAALGERGPAE